MTENIYTLNGDSRVPVVTFRNPKTGKEQIAEHLLRMPTFEEDEQKERETTITRKQGAKIENTRAVVEESEDKKANVNLYNKIAKSVKGYDIEGIDSSKTEDTAVTLKSEEKTILDLIPDDHKVLAVNGMVRSTLEVEIPEDEGTDFSFKLGSNSISSAGKEWKIIQKIGGQFKREDGTLQPPDYEVSYLLKQPLETQKRKYDKDSLSEQTWYSVQDGGMVEKMSTKLKTLTDLFDELIISIDNANLEIDGNEIKIDVSNREHVKLIPSTFKKNVVIRLFNTLRADLGNS